MTHLEIAVANVFGSSKFISAISIFTIQNGSKKNKLKQNQRNKAIQAQIK